MLAVGLTGGIGSGKSAVADLLVARGAVLIDADQVARDVVAPGGPAYQPLIDRFSETRGPAVLVLNPRAGGTGLNITAANHVIHYNLEWNPALEDQASARAYRRGHRLECRCSGDSETRSGARRHAGWRRRLYGVGQAAPSRRISQDGRPAARPCS